MNGKLITILVNTKNIAILKHKKNRNYYVYEGVAPLLNTSHFTLQFFGT